MISIGFRRFAPLLIGMVLVSLAGCGSRADERGTRVGVRGTVLLDKKPLERARIVFRAATGENTITATGKIVDGMYEIPAEHGPLVGKMRVEIQPEAIELEEFEAARGGDIRKNVQIQAVKIPAMYNTKSTLVADVTADETQNFLNFSLKSQPQKK